MVTTIQLNENVKEALKRIKTKKETYEDAIVKMMNSIEKQKRNQKELLKEGCKAMANENMRITKEFESIEDLGEWEW